MTADHVTKKAILNPSATQESESWVKIELVGEDEIKMDLVSFVIFSYFYRNMFTILVLRYSCFWGNETVSQSPQWKSVIFWRLPKRQKELGFVKKEEKNFRAPLTLNTIRGKQTVKTLQACGHRPSEPPWKKGEEEEEAAEPLVIFSISLNDARRSSAISAFAFVKKK